jgi:hypothetical protein
MELVNYQVVCHELSYINKSAEIDLMSFVLGYRPPDKGLVQNE